MKPGQQALVVAGAGRYSFKGAAYVRGGIFDRIELIQETNSIRFRDRDHTRLGSLAADGAPDFPEIALFMVPADFAFDATEPWALQLLVQRVVGARDKAWVTFDLGYTLPETYLKRGSAGSAGRSGSGADRKVVAGRRPRSPRADDRRGSVVDADMARGRPQDRHSDAGARRADVDLLLPEFSGPSSGGVHVGPPLLSAVHSRLAGMVCEPLSFQWSTS
ncbi:hypothetical protein BRDID11002_74770 [Bradyrhizobium diazoefficiens]